jgi:hypothetical protein
MDFGTLLKEFGHDDKVKWVLCLIAADFVLGICAAIVTKKFRFSYLADFLRADVLGKVLPWFVLYALGKVTTQKLPGGVTFATLADGAFAIIAAAIGASILKSLAELGLFGATGKNAAKMDPKAGVVAQALFAPEEPIEAIVEAQGAAAAAPQA